MIKFGNTEQDHQDTNCSTELSSNSVIKFGNTEQDHQESFQDLCGIQY